MSYGEDGARRDLVVLTVAWLAGLASSCWIAQDRSTWVMEVLPAVIALPVLWATWQHLPLSRLVYGLVAIHGLILMLGGAYTYAKVPLGFWIQDWLHLDRNPYDRVGHFAQGFVPAFVARELLIRGFGLPRGKLLGFLVVCVCLAISATYELIEWRAAVALGQGADAFLGTQGDPWDTQEDMATALVAAIIAMTCFTGLHDRSMARRIGAA